MLSKSAFNALLKTIEEPPQHVIFILATTEIEKLPDTILSRCQVLQFNKPNKETLIKTIKKVCDEEKINMPKSGMEVIALLGDGSFRDTLGILQKVISTCSSNVISLQDVNNITGSPEAVLINEFVHALNNRDTERSLEVISQVVSKNSSISLFSRIVIERIRTVLLARFAPKVAEEIMKDYSEEEIVAIKSIANKKDSGINSKTLSEMLKAHQDIKYSPLPFIPLELAVIALNEKI
jgi:DNA polymerase-3 subunit gamma/tau